MPIKIEIVTSENFKPTTSCEPNTHRRIVLEIDFPSSYPQFTSLERIQAKLLFSCYFWMHKPKVLCGALLTKSQVFIRADFRVHFQHTMLNSLVCQPYESTFVCVCERVLMCVRMCEWAYIGFDIVSASFVDTCKAI